MSVVICQQNDLGIKGYKMKVGEILPSLFKHFTGVDVWLSDSGLHRAYAEVLHGDLEFKQDAAGETLTFYSHRKDDTVPSCDRTPLTLSHLRSLPRIIGTNAIAQDLGCEHSMAYALLKELGIRLAICDEFLPKDSFGSRVADRVLSAAARTKAALS